MSDPKPLPRGQAPDQDSERQARKISLANAGGGGDSGSMETRVAILEQIAKDTRDLLARLDARMDRSDALMDARMDRSDARLDARLDRLDARMDRSDALIDARMSQMDTRMDRVDMRMDRFDTRMDHLDTRMGRLEDRMASDFKWLVGAGALAAVGLAGLMAHGFHWF